jgi:hypothetical protein
LAAFFIFRRGANFMSEAEEKNNDFYLNLQIRKAGGEGSTELGKTDENGNYIFEVEASNENLDLQNQIVLQNALLESKENFITRGVISNDHLHKTKDKNGNTITDNSMVIGEPIDVKTDGKSTIVVGKLYHSNPKAQDFIRLLKDGSTRVHASVGGIFPQVVKDARTGIEKITHVLWNDLALTVMPVNNTVGSAVFAKCMNPEDFVKALSAGYGTDSAAKTDGNALIPEALGFKTQAVESAAAEDKEKEVIRSLVACLETGEIKGEEQSEKYLVDKGINEEQSRQIVREIIEQGGQIMKSSFSSRIKDLMKSFAGNPKKDDEDVKDENEDATNDVDEDSDDETVNLDDDTDDEDESDDEDDNTAKATKKSCKKNVAGQEDDEEAVDGTAILKSLNDEIASMHKALDTVQKQYVDLGNAVVGLGEMVSAIGGEKLPPKSVGIVKSINAIPGAPVNATAVGEKLTNEDFAFAQKALCKAVKDGEISIEKSSMWNGEIQKSMALGTPMSNECYSFLSKKWVAK